MRLSYCILTRNRQDAVLRTISLLPSLTPLPSNQWEVWVVDNASDDQTAEKIKERFARVNILRLPRDKNRSALNFAFSRCKGECIIWLNADTMPADARAIRLMLTHMQQRPQCAAVSAKLMTSAGAMIAHDFPTVIVPGASCIRLAALHRNGGFDEDLPGACGDYDLSFRLWQNGLRVERRDDILFNADPSQVIVESADLLGHQILIHRYLPRDLRRIYSSDWWQRCAAICRTEPGFFKVPLQSLSARIWTTRRIFQKQYPLGDEAMEQIFGFRQQSQTISHWARRHSVWRVVLADFSKNIFSAYNACKSSGLQIRCVADNNSAFKKLEYRSLPISPINKAFEGGGIDGVILTTLNPANIDSQTRALRHYFKGPLLQLWQPPRQAMQASVSMAA